MKEMNKMEFIKVGKDKWLIKSSNGRLISEKEKLELENNELIIKDFKSNECQGKTTQKITKNKKRIKEIETAPIKEEDADDTIKETN
jgi:hypothetical protein